MAEPLKRPENFQMGFQTSLNKEGVASIYVEAFGREHIPFLMKALAIADDILAIPLHTTAQNAEGNDEPPTKEPYQ